MKKKTKTMEQTAAEHIDLLDAIEKEANLSPKSKSSYKELVSAIRNRADGVPIHEVVLHPKKYIPLLKQWYQKDTTLKSQISTILTLFRYNPKFKLEHLKEYEQWSEAFKEAKAKVDERYESNRPTERQASGYVEYQDIIAARDKLPEGHMHRLLLGMYTHLRPMRCEYARVAIYRTKVPEPAEDNYILLKGSPSSKSGVTGRLIIREFKTKKHHDAFDLELPKPLIDDLMTSLEEKPREWLFVNSRGEPYTRHLYIKWTTRTFQSIFKKPLTVSLIRHSLISSLNFNELSIKDKKDIATSMAHTVAMQDRYRLLFDNDKASCNCVCDAKDSTNSTSA